MIQSTGRGLESAGRAMEPAVRAMEPARRALEPAGRPGASWVGQLKGLGGGGQRKKERKNRAFLVCGGTIGHCPQKVPPAAMK